jgi:hypothetical protein
MDVKLILELREEARIREAEYPHITRLLRRAAEAIEDTPPDVVGLCKLMESYAVSLEAAGCVCRSTVAEIEPMFRMIADDLRALLEGREEASGLVVGSRIAADAGAAPGVSHEPTERNPV